MAATKTPEQKNEGHYLVRKALRMAEESGGGWAVEVEHEASIREWNGERVIMTTVSLDRQEDHPLLQDRIYFFVIATDRPMTTPKFMGFYARPALGKGDETKSVQRAALLLDVYVGR